MVIQLKICDGKTEMLDPGLATMYHHERLAGEAEEEDEGMCRPP